MAPAVKPAGYSGTALLAKLGIKTGARVQLVSAPAGFNETLGDLPDGVRKVARGILDFAILFVRKKSDLETRFPQLRDRLESNGMLWVAWPKKTSSVDTDLSEGVVRRIGLDAGVVDVKVCAIDNIWSGLKFVRRLRDR